MNSVAFFWRAYMHRLPRVVGHRYFFLALCGFFVLNAGWLALSVAYPMIFDEEYHVGIIDIYARQLSPFITVQPPEAALYGDITRYTSYLYHYLASFPYRLVSFFTSDIQTHIVVLRFLNVAVMVGALVLYRKVLLMARISPVLVHIALLFFVMTPLLAYAAAQVSYDPLTFALIPAMAICAIRVVQSKKWFWWLVALGVIGALSTLIKFTMLPFLTVFFVVALGMRLRRSGPRFLTQASEQIRRSPWLVVVGAAVLAALSMALFIERYGGNVLRYQTLTPDCAAVQSVETCNKYGPWARNAMLEQQQLFMQQPVDNIAVYTVFNWIPHIVDDFFIAAVYPTASAPVLHQGTPQNLEGTAGHVLTRVVGWAGFIGGVIVVAWQWRRLAQYKALLVCLAAGAVYVGILHARNYSEYVAFAMPVAVQGRYILSILPFVFAAILICLSAIRTPRLKVGAFTVACICFVFGAGALPYIMYGQPLWSWPWMVEPNLVLQGILNYIRW
ncbi:MAG TPA: hypothetical protein VFZ48_04240 [Candidatus Saccharimonadales bacterium]